MCGTPRIWRRRKSSQAPGPPEGTEEAGGLAALLGLDFRQVAREGAHTKVLPCSSLPSSVVQSGSSEGSEVRTARKHFSSQFRKDREQKVRNLKWRSTGFACRSQSFNSVMLFCFSTWERTQIDIKRPSNHNYTFLKSLVEQSFSHVTQKSFFPNGSIQVVWQLKKAFFPRLKQQ